MPKKRGVDKMAYDYYDNVHRLILDIDSNRIILNNYVSERAHLILLSEPPKMRPINYEEPRVQSSSSRMSDNQILERISELSRLIDRYQMILKEKQEKLESLKHAGNRMLTRLQARNKDDIKLRVFILSYIDGLTNEQIYEQIGNYEMQTIWNVKTQLNKLFVEQQYSLK